MKLPQDMQARANDVAAEAAEFPRRYRLPMDSLMSTGSGKRLASRHMQAHSVEIMTEGKPEQGYIMDTMTSVAVRLGRYVGPRIERGLLKWYVKSVPAGTEIRYSWYSREGIADPMVSE